LAEHGRLWMKPGKLGKQTVYRKNLPNWKDAIYRHVGYSTPVMMQRPYG
jgi:hypothetical protein